MNDDINLPQLVVVEAAISVLRRRLANLLGADHALVTDLTMIEGTVGGIAKLGHCTKLSRSLAEMLAERDPAYRGVATIAAGLEGGAVE